MIARKRICLVCSAPGTFEAFLAPLVRKLAVECDVSVAMNGQPAQPDTHQATFHPVGVERSVMPLRDSRALFQLVRLFSKEKFDVVHSFTPKAGLLAMLAARFTGIPRRHHTFTGQVWATRTGIARWFLKAMDRILAKCATEVLADSPSQLQFLVQQGIVAAGRGHVLGAGSVCGVDLERFKPDATMRLSIRQGVGLPGEAMVFLFIGRMNTDKGLLDLAAAFEALAREYADVFLLLVGPDEEQLVPKIRATLSRSADRLFIVGSTPRPEDYMQAADVLCLPSYREGFGSVIIEAAASGLPCIASKIYGITDAVEENVTGLLHTPRDTNQILACMRLLHDKPRQRLEMGSAAHARVERFFAQPVVVEALAGFYKVRAIL